MNSTIQSRRSIDDDKVATCKRIRPLPSSQWIISLVTLILHKMTHEHTSTTTPSCITMIRSHSSTVDKRCATVMHVRPLDSPIREAWIPAHTRNPPNNHRKKRDELSVRRITGELHCLGSFKKCALSHPHHNSSLNVDGFIHLYNLDTDRSDSSDYYHIGLVRKHCDLRVPCSVCESSADVASSHMTRRGFRTKARAIATRCFSPPLNFSPRSPTTVV